jgi:hypothetical protein
MEERFAAVLLDTTLGFHLSVILLNHVERGW